MRAISKVFLILIFSLLACHQIMAAGWPANPPEDHHSSHDPAKHGKDMPTIECYHCTFAESADDNESRDCLESERIKDSTNVEKVNCSSGCAYWAGMTTLNFTVIRTCSHTKSPNCKDKAPMSEILDYTHFSSGSPFSEDDKRKMGNKTEICTTPLCNGGSVMKPCESNPNKSKHAGDDGNKNKRGNTKSDHGKSTGNSNKYSTLLSLSLACLSFSLWLL